APGRRRGVAAGDTLSIGAEGAIIAFWLSWQGFDGPRTPGHGAPFPAVTGAVPAPVRPVPRRWAEPGAGRSGARDTASPDLAQPINQSLCSPNQRFHVEP